MEVHRVRAVRFSRLSSNEEESDEDIGDEEEGGFAETESRNGSQQHLDETSAGREISKQKSILCGLCCSKTPAVSVWNCDGEILPFTEILSRYTRLYYSIYIISLVTYLSQIQTTTFISSFRIHGQLVRVYARGIEDGAALHTCSDECDKCERRSILHK